MADLLFSRAARGAVILLVGLGGFFAGGLRAQDVQGAYVIPLETFAYTNGTGSTYYKYGINIGIGGGTAQTFEFDTGGEGFYAAGVTGGWWGSSVGVSSESFSKNFGSGIAYHGHVASGTGLAFYAPASTGGTLVLNLSGNTFAVGQAETIVQGSTTLWDANTATPTSPAPVQDHFYGDFGLTMKKGAHGIENVFAQLSYGGGVSGGYVVATGTYGSTGGGYVQVGLTAEDLNNPETMWFAMSGSSSEMFTGGNFATYSAELLKAKVKLVNDNGEELTLDVGVNLDTGNPTPGLDYNSGDKDELKPFSDDDVTDLADGVRLRIDAKPTPDGPDEQVIAFTVGNLYGENSIYEKERSDGGDTYLNIGAKLFQEYKVTYDLANGRLGFTPYAVPEPTTTALLLAALAGAVARRRRSRT